MLILTLTIKAVNLIMALCSHHAPKEGLIDPTHSVQIGIRTEHSDKLGFNVISADTANDWSVAQIVEKIKATVGDMLIYLTFDIDCLDPAYAPGTGTLCVVVSHQIKH